MVLTQNPCRSTLFTLQQNLPYLSQLDFFAAGTGNLSSTDGLLTSASEQWKAVLEASTFSQQEIPPEIVAAKTADVQHTQVLTDEDVSAFGHHAHPGLLILRYSLQCYSVQPPNLLCSGAVALN